MQNLCSKLFIFISLWMICSLHAEDDIPEWLKESRAIDAAYAIYSPYVSQITRSLAEEMKSELGLICQGDSGMMHGEVEVVGIKFAASRRATLEEARALQLFVMERLVQKINAHEKIQPFLQERPFTYKRVDIFISFSGKQGEQSDGTVQYVFNVPDMTSIIRNKNRIFYRANDPFTDQPTEVWDEHYEEAVQAAKEAAIPYPFTHKTTEKEAAVDRLFAAFTRNMNLRRNLKYSCIGGNMIDGIEDVGAKFNVVGRTYQQNARKLGVYVAEELLAAINNDPALRPYLKEYPFPASRLRLRINFTDRRYNSYLDDGLESITLENNEMTYYHYIHVPQEWGPKEEWPKRTLVFAKEPYPEALKIIEETPPPFSPLQYLYNWLLYLVGLLW